LVIFAIVFCVVYEITHRDRKGKYYKQNDEVPNVSTTQNNIPNNPTFTHPQPKEKNNVN
jgi:hypothetical protein